MAKKNEGKQKETVEELRKENQRLRDELRDKNIKAVNKV